VNRTKLLAISTVAVLLFAIVYHIWAGWGLITIHAKGEPLGKVIASMQRQGHASIQTDIPGDTAVTMDCVKVPLTNALESLSVATDSRWRFLYFVAPDKADLKSAELSWFGGQRPDGWRMVSFPLGNMFSLGDDTATPDPRTDIWTPKTAAPAAVQDFFAEAASLTNAGFAFPVAWNPTVKSTPSAGRVDHVIPKLISAAGGREDELFFLSKNNRRGPRTAEGGDGPGGDLQVNPELIAEHIQAEINRLPPEERTEAQANFDTERAFRASLQTMTDEQRRDAWQQHMQDPQVQQQMANRMDARESNMGHDQRMQRFQGYVDRKFAATGRP